jgi:hypothetical protein
MARRKKSRRARKMTLPLGLLIPGLLSTVAWGKHIMEGGDNKAKMRRAIKHSIGYDIDAKSFAIGDAWLALGWGSGVLIHKGIGGYGGVNRALGAARVPIIRL